MQADSEKKLATAIKNTEEFEFGAEVNEPEILPLQGYENGTPPGARSSWRNR